MRRLLDGAFVIELNPLLEFELRRQGLDNEAALQTIKASGTVRCANALPEDIRHLFPTALEIAPESHLRMQAAFQAHVDAAVSKAVNLPATRPRARFARFSR